VHGRVFILAYVDDLIVAGEKLAGVAAVKRSVSTKFEVRDMGEVNDSFGMKVMRDREAKTLHLSNPGHMATLLEAFGMETSTLNEAPMASGVKLTKTRKDLLPDANRYANLVSSLFYLSTTTRRDIAFAVEVLSRFMSSAGPHARGKGRIALPARDNPPLGGRRRQGVAAGVCRR